jgi:hypothetical protein
MLKEGAPFLDALDRARARKRLEMGFDVTGPRNGTVRS